MPAQKPARELFELKEDIIKSELIVGWMRNAAEWGYLTK